MHADFIIPVTFFGVIAYIVKVVSDNRIRRLLIEKGEINENLKYLFADRVAAAVPTSLKWGMVFIAVGLAFLFSQVLNFGWDNDTALIAMIFLFGGAALVIYYFIAGRMLKKAGKPEQAG